MAIPAWIPADAALDDDEVADPATVALLTELHEPDPAALLAEIVNRPAWHAEAACRGGDVSPWFLARGQSSAAGRAICAGCPVREPCSTFAEEARGR